MYALLELLPGHAAWPFKGGPGGAAAAAAAAGDAPGSPASPSAERWALVGAALRLLRAAASAGCVARDGDLAAGEREGGLGGGEALLSAGAPRLALGCLGAALLRLLLLHGGLLLGRCLPPPAETLEVRSHEPLTALPH